jgi:hypothetical protein
MGKPMVIDVVVEAFKSNTTGKDLQSNKIKSYGPPVQLMQPQIQPGANGAAAGVQPQQQQASGW